MTYLSLNSAIIMLIVSKCRSFVIRISVSNIFGKHCKLLTFSQEQFICSERSTQAVMAVERYPAIS